MIPNFKKSSKANRGKPTEDALLKFLDSWVARDPQNREIERLVDTKAAGRIIKAAKADFAFYASMEKDVHGLLEAKETEHLFRLERAKVPQLPSLRKRSNVGGSCYVVVHHSVSGAWRAIPVWWLLDNGDKGSWNLSEFPEASSPGDALAKSSWVFQR